MKTLATLTAIPILLGTTLAEVHDRIGSSGGPKHIHIETYDSTSNVVRKEVFVFKAHVISIEVIPEYNDPAKNKEEGGQYFVKINISRIHPQTQNSGTIGGASSASYFIPHKSRAAAMAAARKLVSEVTNAEQGSAHQSTTRPESKSK
ncbi:hypothetical protein SAMN02745181_3017 [Rubritalea squalenifaciens DSM 18772]|uniref:Uncharacterized protein n=1 Tax=Rubritalea squalenifaciens DSM 18772 TaxID=1123071 RepID=A0A1M6NYT7_9BACT|nr:hypothetical protein [Rubritalea squalenifaciens]SHK00792.1 hypothetical protein SAMN02745181_3017 [Rubritalea squalenifaciens DSM 18772]